MTAMRMGSFMLRYDDPRGRAVGASGRVFWQRGREINGQFPGTGYPWPYGPFRLIWGVSLSNYPSCKPLWPPHLGVFDDLHGMNTYRKFVVQGVAVPSYPSRSNSPAVSSTARRS